MPSDNKIRYWVLTICSLMICGTWWQLFGIYSDGQMHKVEYGLQISRLDRFAWFYFEIRRAFNYRIHVKNIVVTTKKLFAQTVNWIKIIWSPKDMAVDEVDRTVNIL